MNAVESVHTGEGTINQVEQQQVLCDAVETVVLWNNTCQKVDHLRMNQKEPRSFSIGENPACDFPVPAEFIGGLNSLALVRVEGASAMATVPVGARAEIQLPDGRIETTGPDGKPLAGNVVLDDRKGIIIYLGPWTFVLKHSAVPEKFVADGSLGFRPSKWTFLSIAMHAVFFAIIGLVPPDAAGLSLNGGEDTNRFTKYMIVAPEIRPAVVPEINEKEDPGGKTGKAAAGTEGQAGDRTAKKTGKRMGTKGFANNPRPTIARDISKDMVQNMGVLGLMSNHAGPTSPFGVDNPIGADPEDALGALIGNEIGSSFGYGGLGIKGAGRGGGCTSGDCGTYGVGQLGTIGNSYRNGNGKNPYGGSVGGLKGRTGKRPVGVKSGIANVKGSLSKDVIRRVVQRQINQIKFCYEKGLGKNPSLSGRVSVQFIISGTGAVQGAAVKSSSVGDIAVEQCIANTVKRMSFPQPKNGGVVIVTYPFSLVNSNI